MSEPSEPAPVSSAGFTVLDGAALVAGAAVAAAHVRDVIPAELLGPGWVVVWGTFFWIGVTASGPFLYLFRRFFRPTTERHAWVGEILWGIMGVPWLLTSLLLGDAVGEQTHEWMALVLTGGLAVSGVVALSILWSRWIAVSPERASRVFDGPWTNRVGLILAVAWPIQCGLGLVVAG